MKNTQFAASLGVVALVLGACGVGDVGESAEGANPSEASTATQIDYRACLVSDTGGWDDKSFNQSAKEGLDKAVEELGIQSKETESKDSSEFSDNVKAMIGANCDLTIGVGFLLANDIAASAAENPDKNFGLVDFTFENPQGNERALVFNTQEAAYLAGYAAAAMSTTGTVATFGGLAIPSVTIFMDGFADGIAKYNEENDESVELLGWDKETQTGEFTGNFDDQVKGTQLATEMIQQGADIIMPVAGPVGLGAAAAAKVNGNTLIIGVDSDWVQSASEYKDIVLTSVMKDISHAVYDTVMEASAGNWTSDNYVGTLANAGVGLAPFYDFESQLPDGLTDELDELKQDIIDGDIVVESQSAFEVN